MTQVAASGAPAPIPNCTTSVRISYSIRHAKDVGCMGRDVHPPISETRRGRAGAVRGKSIGRDFRGIERGIADRAVPALAAAGNDGSAKNSVELPPDKLAWSGAGGMAVHINDIHAFVVLFHLGLKAEILIAFGTDLLGKRTTRPIAVKPACVSLFIAEAAA